MRRIALSDRPINSCDDCAGRIRRDVENVPAGVMDEHRTDKFTEDGPEHEMAGNFIKPRHPVMISQPQEPIEPEHRRQCAWDQPEIIEMPVQKRRVKCRHENPSVDRIGKASGQEKRIPQISKPDHSKQSKHHPADGRRNKKLEKNNLCGNHNGGAGKSGSGSREVCRDIARAQPGC